MDRIPSAVWLLMTGVAAGYVVAFGVNLPVADEWATVDTLAGDRPLLPWLFAWHNEHRLPLPRLVYWGVYRLTGDLRDGMFVTVIGLSVAAHLAMQTARQIRGQVWVGFMLSALLAIGGVCAAMTLAGWKRLAVVGGCGLLLPLCGGHGCILAVGPLISLVWIGWNERPRWQAVVPVIGIVGLLAWYAMDFPPPAGYRPPVTGEILATGLFGYLVNGFGPGAWSWIAFRGLAVMWLACGLVALVWRRWPVPVVGFVLAALLLAVAVAGGRGAFGEWAVRMPRYVPFAALVPVGLLLGWAGRHESYGPGHVFVLAVLVFPFNVAVAGRAGLHHRDLYRGVVADLQAGVPVEVVADRTHFQTFNDRAAFAFAVEYHLRTVPHLPPHRVESLPADAVTKGHGGWVVTLNRPVLALRVRGKYADADPLTPVRIRFEWDGQKRSDPGSRLEETAAVLWLGGATVREVRFDPGDEWTPVGVEVLVAD